MATNKPIRRVRIFNQPYTLRNSVEWIESGEKYFERLEALIDSASVEIHIHTYIFASDETGKRIAEALIRAANRRVLVFVLVDAYGSQSMSNVIIKSLRNAGIQFRKYGRFFSQGRFHIGRRMHHKITVIDGTTSIVGGINISNNYNDLPDSTAWLDFAVIMRGDISRRLQFVCRKRWIGWNFKRISARKLLKIRESEKILLEDTAIRVRRNDFVRNKHEITYSYREAFRQSKKSLLIVGGYFLPGGQTRRLMKAAIKRGVIINVIVPEKSDVGLLILARRYLYDWLKRINVGVYEYKPSNVHGKVIIYDDSWTSIGSYDLNNLSAYSNIELNVDIKNENFSADLANHIRQIIINDCTPVTSHIQNKNISLFSRMIMWLAYNIVKTFFVLSILLSSKKEKEF